MMPSFARRTLFAATVLAVALALPAQAAPETDTGAAVFRDAAGTAVVFVLPAADQVPGFIPLSRYRALQAQGLAPLVFTARAETTRRAVGLQWAVGVWR